MRTFVIGLIIGVVLTLAAGSAGRYTTLEGPQSGRYQLVAAYDPDTKQVVTIGFDTMQGCVVYACRRSIVGIAETTVTLPGPK